jgi:hypothetical protein
MQDNLSLLVGLTQQIMERGKELMPVLKKEEQNMLDKRSSNDIIPTSEYEYLLRMYLALEFFGVSKNNFKNLLKEYEKVELTRAKKFLELYQSLF